jgi:hypothetical protein
LIFNKLQLLIWKVFAANLYPFGEPILRIGEKLPILKTFLASSFAGEGRRPCCGGNLECG